MYPKINTTFSLISARGLIKSFLKLKEEWESLFIEVEHL